MNNLAMSDMIHGGIGLKYNLMESCLKKIADTARKYRGEEPFMFDHELAAQALDFDPIGDL